MSESSIARTLGQSVLEVLEEECFFMSCRLSEGNNADSFRGLKMNNRDRYAVEESQGDKPLFSVSKTIVFVGNGWSFPRNKLLHLFDREPCPLRCQLPP